MKLLKISLLALVLGLNIFLPAISFAQSQTCDPNLNIADCQKQILKTVGGGNQGYGDNTDVTANTLAEKVGQVIGMVLSVFGVVFFGLVVYSGFQWMSAGGNEEWVTKAKDRIIRASIGLGIVMMAWALTTFIVSRFQVGATVTPEEQADANDCHQNVVQENCVNDRFENQYCTWFDDGPGTAGVCCNADETLGTGRCVK